MGEEIDDELGVTSGTCGENLTWKLDDKGILTISGTGDMENYNYLAYETVSPWEKSNVKKIVVEDGVTSIGAEAFRKRNRISNRI